MANMDLSLLSPIESGFFSIALLVCSVLMLCGTLSKRYHRFNMTILGEKHVPPGMCGICFVVFFFCTEFLLKLQFLILHLLFPRGKA